VAGGLSRRELDGLDGDFKRADVAGGVPTDAHAEVEVRCIEVALDRDGDVLVDGDAFGQAAERAVGLRQPLHRVGVRIHNHNAPGKQS